MNPATKACTKCGATKPLAAFNLRRSGDPDGPRRSQCTACVGADGKRRRLEGPSVMSELLKLGCNNPDALSDRARAAAFTDEPIDPDALAAYRARQNAEAARARKLERRLMRDVRPMRFACLET